MSWVLPKVTKLPTQNLAPILGSKSGTESFIETYAKAVACNGVRTTKAKKVFWPVLTVSVLIEGLPTRVLWTPQ